LGVWRAADLVDPPVIGGGINGAAIARDAAGRGLSVVLCEKGDLAWRRRSAAHS
jgi:glycerol-3-phosphate dehydrogenase